MRNEPHPGEVAVAKISRRVSDRRYRLPGTIKTGNHAGDDCFIRHKTTIEIPERYAIIRIREHGNYEDDRSFLDETVAADYITSTIPKEFGKPPIYSTAQNRNVLFYAR